jgi:dihydroxy-acid dehydratase
MKMPGYEMPFDKSRLPSRYTTVGPERAPHRSFLYAMGLSSEEIAQPLVGVASCWNEAAPCNIALMRQAQAVKKGVAAARARRASSAPSP